MGRIAGAFPAAVALRPLLSALTAAKGWPGITLWQFKRVRAAWAYLPELEFRLDGLHKQRESGSAIGSGGAAIQPWQWEQHRGAPVHMGSTRGRCVLNTRHNRIRYGPPAMPCDRRAPSISSRSLQMTSNAARLACEGPSSIQKGTRVLIALWDALMFGRVPGTRPNISESHREISTRVPFCIAGTRREGGSVRSLRVSIFAARTLNPTGQSRVMLSLRLRAAWWPRQKGKRSPKMHGRQRAE